MDRELKNLTLNISQLAALSGVHRQTAAARLQNLPVAGGHESNLKLYRVVDIVSAFLALPPPVAEGEMDAHERKAWYQSERERLKFEQETAQLIPASDVRREFAIWAKAVVQVLETLPDILERDCGLQPAAVSRVQSIIDDLRDQIALRVTDAVAQYMRVPMGAGNSVPWDPLVAPYVIEPMNCLASREYDAVIFVGPARTGKTIGLIDGWVIYNVICDPADMLIIQMTEEKAREHSKKRLARTFRVSPEVVSRLSPNKNDNNVYDRTFLAGNSENIHR